MAVKYVERETVEAVIADQTGIEFVGDLPELHVEPEALLRTGEMLKSSPALRLEHLASVTAVDYPEKIELVYHLYSYALKHEMVMKVNLAKQGPDLPQAASVISLWPTANLQEREVYDLMGVIFTGHPDLCRILLPDEFVGHPLRKDFKVPSQRERGAVPC